MSYTIEEHIIYSQMSKNDEFQSIRKKGAVSSYNILMSFLNEIGNNITIDTAIVQASVWEQNDKLKVKLAKEFLNELTIKLGKPGDNGTYVKTGSWNDWFPRTYIERYPYWYIDSIDVIKYLKFIDSMKFPSELSYRPPVSLLINLNFMIKKQFLNGHKHPENSSASINLSQSSNSISLTLLTPYTENNEEFIKFRSTLQSICPIELKDKYFYIEKTHTNGKVTYRKLFTNSH